MLSCYAILQGLAGAVTRACDTLFVVDRALSRGHTCKDRQRHTPTRPHTRPRAQFLDRPQWVWSRGHTGVRYSTHTRVSRRHLTSPTRGTLPIWVLNWTTARMAVQCEQTGCEYFSCFGGIWTSFWGHLDVFLEGNYWQATE